MCVCERDFGEREERERVDQTLTDGDRSSRLTRCEEIGKESRRELERAGESWREFKTGWNPVATRVDATRDAIRRD